MNTAKHSCKSTPSCLYGGSTAAEEVNMLNTVAISGVLGYPLELKKDKNGKSYIRSSVSVSRNYKGEDGYYLKDYIGFVAMGQNAEYLAKYAQKGDRIEIKGRMQSYAQTFWEYYEEDCFPKKREKKIYKTEILVEDVEVVSKAEQKNTEDGSTATHKYTEEELKEKLEAYRATKETNPDLVF